MPEDRPNVHPPLLFLLLQAYYWFDDALQSSVRAADGPNVPRLQSMVMANVAAGIGRPSEIARNLGISRQAVNTLLRELTRKELVELVPDATDLRAKHVQYHPKAQRMIQVSRGAMTANESVVLAAVGQGRFDDFMDVLNKINEFRNTEVGNGQRRAGQPDGFRDP